MTAPALLTTLCNLVDPAGALTGDQIQPQHYVDPMGAPVARPELVLRPRDTAQVSAILAACHAAGQPVTPQGGLTGLVSAGAPRAGEVVLSLARMNRIVAVDDISGTLTAEAGVPLYRIHEVAAEHQWLYPLDLGARGSCTIGGNLATNAGGNRVIRHGMTRDLVLGLEVVLADGTLVNSLNRLRKNNTGYDLKQLFIGSEGTLGVITQAVLRLVPQPKSHAVALCAVPDFAAVTQLLVQGQQRLGGTLTAFEVLWSNAYDLVAKHGPAVTVPLPPGDGFYVLLECMGADAERDGQNFLEFLEAAREQGWVQDAVLADTGPRMTALWRVRDAAAEVSAGVGVMHTYDVSLAVTDMDHFGREVERRLRDRWPALVLGIFGHLGDGNLHLVVHVGPDTAALHDDIDTLIYDLIGELGGSVSAEHGIGLMKKPYLGRSRGATEIALMRTLKQALDPKGILSPGRIFD